MKIIIYSHATYLNNDDSVTREQTEILEKSGLLDVAEVKVMIHYQNEPFSWLQDRWKDRNVEFKLFDESYREWYEYTTCMEIQNDCEKSEEEFYLLYIHHKGNFTTTSANQNWRYYMQYFNIERWKECVAKLNEGYDTCGAAWAKHDEKDRIKYYPGNFFWAKSSYIKKCQKLVNPKENNFQSQFSTGFSLRFDLELWHGSGQPNAYDIDSNSYDRCWYNSPEKYRNDMKQTFVYSTSTK